MVRPGGRRGKDRQMHDESKMMIPSSMMMGRGGPSGPSMKGQDRQSLRRSDRRGGDGESMDLAGFGHGLTEGYERAQVLQNLLHTQYTDTPLKDDFDDEDLD